MFTVELGLEILERTPGVLRAWLGGLSPEWLAANEGPDTWNPYDVVGHLIHGERTDWMARADIILGGGGTFATFDRLAQFRESEGKSLAQLLDEFAAVRRANVARLRSLSLTDADLQKTGTHPKFGTVTLGQLLSTWVAHDLDHLMQISRVMGKQLKEDVGPWTEYLRVVRS
jgi:uncharacterized damage-inducible protein DinB